MEQPRNRWCREVIGHIRFKPDRDRVWDELQAHIEDRCEGMRERGMEAEEAERRAVAAMGDPAEVGKALDKAHKPWLGWLWIFSKVVVIAAIVVSLLTVYPTVKQYQNAVKNDADERNTVEFWVGDSPLISRHAVGRTVEIDGYRFTVDEVSWYGEEEVVRLAICVTVRRPLFQPEINDYGAGMDAFYVMDEAGVCDIGYWEDRNPEWPRRRVCYYDTNKVGKPLTATAIYVYDALNWDPEWVELSIDIQGETYAIRFPGPGGDSA